MIPVQKNAAASSIAATRAISRSEMEALLQNHKKEILEALRVMMRAEFAKSRRDETDRLENGEPRSEPETITIKQAMAALRCSNTGIQKRLKDGRLIRYQPGGPRTPVGVRTDSPALRVLKCQN
jgi:hypothetical protein